MANVQVHMDPLEQAIRNKLIPALLNLDGPMISDVDRELYALPVRLVGLAIDNPVADSSYKFADSIALTNTLKNLIKSSEKELVINEKAQNVLKAEREKVKEARLEKEAKLIQERLPPKKSRAMEFAKGSSPVLTTLPLASHGFNFSSKREWWDVLALRYNHDVPRLPPICPCGSAYSLDHSQQCKVGGFIHMRHDEQVRLFASLAGKVFKDVEVEPPSRATIGRSI